MREKNDQLTAAFQVFQVSFDTDVMCLDDDFEHGDYRHTRQSSRSTRSMNGNSSAAAEIQSGSSEGIFNFSAISQPTTSSQMSENEGHSSVTDFSYYHGSPNQQSWSLPDPGSFYFSQSQHSLEPQTQNLSVYPQIEQNMQSDQNASSSHSQTTTSNSNSNLTWDIKDTELPKVRLFSRCSFCGVPCFFKVLMCCC